MPFAELPLRLQELCEHSLRLQARILHLDHLLTQSLTRETSRRPVAMLDRIVVSAEWTLREAGVHHSALAARGSDHLPVFARLVLPKI